MASDSEFVDMLVRTSKHLPAPEKKAEFVIELITALDKSIALPRRSVLKKFLMNQLKEISNTEDQELRNKAFPLWLLLAKYSETMSLLKVLDNVRDLYQKYLPFYQTYIKELVSNDMLCEARSLFETCVETCELTHDQAKAAFPNFAEEDEHTLNVFDAHKPLASRLAASSAEREDKPLSLKENLEKSVSPPQPQAASKLTTPPQPSPPSAAPIKAFVQTKAVIHQVTNQSARDEVTIYNDNLTIFQDTHVPTSEFADSLCDHLSLLDSTVDSSKFKVDKSISATAAAVLNDDTHISTLNEEATTACISQLCDRYKENGGIGMLIATFIGAHLAHALGALQEDGRTCRDLSPNNVLLVSSVDTALPLNTQLETPILKLRQHSRVGDDKEQKRASLGFLEVIGRLLFLEPINVIISDAGEKRLDRVVPRRHVDRQMWMRIFTRLLNSDPTSPPQWSEMATQLRNYFVEEASAKKSMWRAAANELNSFICSH